MQFCDECGSMMIGEDGVMQCTNQDCAGEVEQDRERAQAFNTTESQGDSDVIESSEDAAFEGKPTAAVYCDSCENERAWYTIKQTGAADEPPTRFYKCTECGYRWRDYN